jgi:hypothetical protein
MFLLSCCKGVKHSKSTTANVLTAPLPHAAGHSTSPHKETDADAYVYRVSHSAFTRTHPDTILTSDNASNRTQILRIQRLRGLFTAEQYHFSPREIDSPFSLTVHDTQIQQPLLLAVESYYWQ